MSTRNIVKNIRSSAVVEGKPKLPQPTDLDFGQIAINYAEGYETLSFKNNSNEIVSLSVKTVDDVKVNGNSVVSNKTANITMKGSTTPVADTYSTTTFPSPFESKAEHISATDKVDAALKKVETNISKLVNEVVDNENVVSEAISKLANSAGTIDGSNNITYIKATNAHYIKNATSVHDATVKLDSNVFTIKGDVDTLRGEVNAIKGRLNTLESDVDTLKGNVTTINGSINTLGTNVTNLDSKYNYLDTTVINLLDQITTLQGQITTLQGQISSIPTMEYVDLGLPSRTLWAKCNLGAATETDYGDYFMWGSTTPDNNHTCNWANTPFNNGASKFDSTYFNSVKDTLCPNGVLAKEFDAAYKATNGMGRMPTQTEWQELYENTTNKWTQVKGVNGWKFTSKKDTSKYIFIPAAGSRLNSSISEQGNYSYIWSSTSDETGFAHNTYFSFDESLNTTDSSERCRGFSIRPIKI